MRNAIQRIGYAVCLLLVATAGRATEGPPVMVALLGEPRPALSGKPFSGELLIETAHEGELTNFQLQGKDWIASNLDAPQKMARAQGQSWIIPFTATTLDPDQRLEFSFEFDGQRVTKLLDLSERNARRARHGEQMAVVPGSVGNPVPGIDTRHEIFLPEEANTIRDPSEVVSPTAYDITVQGRFTYVRPDRGDGLARVVGADGLTVRVYHEDPGVDEFQAITATDANGFYSVTFSFDEPEDPNLYVEFWCENPYVETEDPTWGDDYWWFTRNHSGFGTVLDLGWGEPPDEEGHGAVHLQTVVTRASRWMRNQGYDCGNVHVEWPDDKTKYTRINRAIHISEERTWWEASACHEFGHHFLHEFSDPVPNAYCNDVCDENPPWDCSHCIWCWESDHVAFNEGIPNYLGWAIPESFATDYFLEAQWIRNLEYAEACEDDGTWDDPLITEGYVSALLQDIHDSHNEDDGHFPGFEDRLSMGPEEILRATNIEDPYSVMDFLRRFRAEYPAQTEKLWETAMNNGIDFDAEPPGVVTDLACLSHTAGVPSANPYVTVVWTRAPDDASGIQGYSIYVSGGSPSMPNETREVGDTFGYVSNSVLTGTWYLNIRAQDNAGNWSPDYVSFGPIIIEEAVPLDLVFQTRPDWDFQLVPTAVPDHTSTSAHVSSTLPGYVQETYYSVSGKNVGSSAATPTTSGRVYMDNVDLGGSTWGVINPGASFLATNVGPIYVYGGRHVLHYQLDSGHDHAETNESNNTWGRQFVWMPLELTVETKTTLWPVRSAVEGWEHLPSGTGLYPNCQGVRFSSEAWWNAVAAWSVDNDENYNIRLHAAATGAESGFDDILEWSSRGTGCLDAIIVNRTIAGFYDWDIGIVSLDPDNDDFCKTIHEISDFVRLLGDSLTVTLPYDRYIHLEEFYVGSSGVGSVSVSVETNPPFSPLYVQWRDEYFQYGGLTDCNAETATDATGKAYLRFDVGDTGYNSLAFFRDPKDGDQAVDITFEIQSTPADLFPLEAAGWHSPAVARPTNDGSSSSVATPDTLHGNAANTYYNFALRNEGPGAADGVEANVFLDGQGTIDFSYVTFPGNANSYINFGIPQTVRGGRHTLSMWIDHDELLEEYDEDNNVYGEQYVWSPLEMSPGDLAWRASPPDRMGGLTHLRSGEGFWYNSDGLRLIEDGGHWTGVAVVSGPSSNVDVRLHETMVGAKSGFAQNLVYSGWGVGHLDFVLANFGATTPRDLDVGVLRITGKENYFARVVESGKLPRYWPVAMASQDVLHLYDVHLAPGRYAVLVHNRGGTVDWGISLHPPDTEFLSKSTVLQDGMAWQSPGGRGERFETNVLVDDVYCLAVWKVGSADVTNQGTYEVDVEYLGPVATDPIPTAPQTTGLRKAYPNPFNPSVTLSYDLAAPGEVLISIHDAAGKRVKTLVREPRPVGRHEVVWNGRDEAGRPVASGVYLARLIAAGASDHVKLVLLK